MKSFCITKWNQTRHRREKKNNNKKDWNEKEHKALKLDYKKRRTEKFRPKQIEQEVNVKWKTWNEEKHRWAPRKCRQNGFPLTLMCIS